MSTLPNPCDFIPIFLIMRKRNNASFYSLIAVVIPVLAALAQRLQCTLHGYAFSVLRVSERNDTNFSTGEYDYETFLHKTHDLSNPQEVFPLVLYIVYHISRFLSTPFARKIVNNLLITRVFFRPLIVNGLLTLKYPNPYFNINDFLTFNCNCFVTICNKNVIDFYP